MTKVFFEKKKLKKHTYQFTPKYKERAIGYLVIDMGYKKDKPFDLAFCFDNELGAIAELSEDDVKRLEKVNSIEERIILFKSFNHYTTSILKLIIYGAEVAHQIYLNENDKQTSKNLNISIKSIDLSMGTSDEILLYTIIKSIWALLDFTPQKDLVVNVLQKPYKIVQQTYMQNIFELIIPYAISTRYVSYNREIDETLTNHYRGIDDIEFEKGRKYQWLI